MNLSQSKCSLEKHFSRSQISSKNSKQFWIFHLKRSTEVHLPSKDEGQGTSYYTQGNLTLWVNTDLGFKFGSLWYFTTKCDIYYCKTRHLTYYKIQQKFITKCIRLCITKCNSFIINFDSYYKMCWYYCKMQQLLELAMFITKCVCTYINPSKLCLLKNSKIWFHSTKLSLCNFK